METFKITIEFLEKQNLSFNTSRRCVYVGNKPITDFDISRFMAELSIENKRNHSKRVLLTCIDVVAHRNEYSEITNKQNL